LVICHKQTLFVLGSKKIRDRFRYIIVVAGNHERICDFPQEHHDLENKFKQIPTVIYLTFNAVTFKQFGDLTILGLSWWDPADITPIFKDFKELPPAFSIDERHNSMTCPLTKISILVSHHPPYGILDDWTGNHNGAKRIVGYLDYLHQEKLLPSHHIFGHVHQLGKKTNQIMAQSQLYPTLTHINVAQSVGFFDFFYNL